MCQEVLPNMIHNKEGNIINISSIWGIVGASQEIMYSITKAGLDGLTKALAKEVGPSHIRVNSIAPGLIDTDMNKELTKEEIIYHKRRNTSSENWKSRRYCQMCELANRG